jgi:hypothetical protein
MTTRQLDRYTLEVAAEICDEESRYYGQGAATCARSIRALAATLPQATTPCSSSDATNSYLVTRDAPTALPRRRRGNDG